MYSYQISLLWIIFGLVSWIIGISGQYLGTPRPEILEFLKDKDINYAVSPPTWIAKVCFLPKRNQKTADRAYLHMQLGGYLLLIIGLFAGFFVTPKLFLIGIFSSLVLYSYIPSLMMKRWSDNRD